MNHNSPRKSPGFLCAIIILLTILSAWVQAQTYTSNPAIGTYKNVGNGFKVRVSSISGSNVTFEVLPESGTFGQSGTAVIKKVSTTGTVVGTGTSYSAGAATAGTITVNMATAGLTAGTMNFYAVKSTDTTIWDGPITITAQKSLSSVAISGGATAWNENTYQDFTLTATFSDGSTSVVSTNSATTWSTSSAYLIFDSGASLKNRLHGKEVTGNQSASFSVSYTSGGVTKSASKTVTIQDIKSLSSVAISGGATAWNENTYQDFTLTATFSDGSTSVVSTDSATTWSTSSAYLIFDSSATLKNRLHGKEVTGNQSATFSASYTSGGVTKTASMTVTIWDSNAWPSVSSYTASSLGGGVTTNFTLNDPENNPMNVDVAITDTSNNPVSSEARLNTTSNIPDGSYSYAVPSSLLTSLINGVQYKARIKVYDTFNSSGATPYYATFTFSAVVPNPLNLHIFNLDGKKLGGLIHVPGEAATAPGGSVWTRFELRQGTAVVAQAAGDLPTSNPDTGNLIWRRPNGSLAPRWTDILTGSGPFTLKAVGIAASGATLESAPFTFTLQNTVSLALTSPSIFPRYKSVSPPAATTINAVATGTSGTNTLTWSLNLGTPTNGTSSSISAVINNPGFNRILCVAKDTSGNRTVESFSAPVAVRDSVGTATGVGSMDFQGVDVASGNFHLPAVDMIVPAIGVPFALDRSYNTAPATVFALDSIPISGGWKFAFEQSLSHAHSNTRDFIDYTHPTVSVRQADGSTIQFFPGSDGYYHPSTPGNHDMLVEDFNAGTFTLYQAATSPLVTVFEVTDQNARANSEYRLKSIKNLRGHGLTVNYTTGSGTKISTITDQSGRAYTFYYTDADAPTRISRVSDFSGRNVYYDWNADGNLLTFTDVRGFVTTYGYGTSGNEAKRLQYIQLPGSNRPISNIAYDSSRRVQSMTMPMATDFNGASTSGTTTFGYLSTRTDLTRPGTGNNIRYETDLDRNILAVIDSYGAANRRTDFLRISPSDLAGQSSRTSDLGLTTRATTQNLTPTNITYSENGRGLVEEVSDGTGTTVVNYPSSVLNAAPGTLSQNLALPTSVTDKRGKTSATQFTPTGELSAILNPYSQGGKITEFDATTGNPRYIDDGRGNITEFQYTATGDIWKIIVPDLYNSTQRTTTFTYPSGNANRGLPTTVTDRKGYQTTIQWDAAGNLTLIRAENLTPLAGESKDIVMAYDANGNRTSVTDRRGQTTNYDFDNMDRPWRVRMPSPDGTASRPTATTEFDTLGRATKVTCPNGNATEQVYGTSGAAAGLVQSVRAYKPGGTFDTVQAITYLADGRTDTVTDGEGIVRTTVYHSSPRQHLVYRITEPAPNGYINYKEFDYDAAENPIRETTGTTAPSHTRPLPSTLYTYDDAGRLSTVINVMNGNWSNPNDAAHIRTQVTYYGDDNIDLITDPRGQPIKHIYTTTGQLETRRDALNNEWTYRYDANGNPTQEIFPGNGSYPSRTITRSFGPLDRLLSINYGDGLNTNVNFSYDANGNRLSMNDRQGATAYAYDLLNRLTSMTHTPNGRSGLSLSYSYWPGGQLKTLTYPGSRAVSYGYDHLDRMSTVTPWTGGAFGYTWRKNGQLDLLTNPNGTQTDYQYNHPGGRLSALVTTRSGTTIANQQFTTDPAGNITRITGEQPLAPPSDATLAMTPDNANRLATIQGQAVTNDPAGRSHALPAPLSATTTWEGMDWLASYTTGGQTSSYGYNGDGVRTHATRSGTTTRYLIDPNAPLPNVTAECNDTNSPQRFYIHGLDLFASIDTSNNVQTYHANHRGDILALTNASGAVTESYGYSPFGLTSASNTSSTNPFRFGGALGVMDEGNGLNFMRARFYSASVGRFLSMDQLLGGLDNTQSLDRFAYALGNPISNFDPSGMVPTKLEAAQIANDVYSPGKNTISGGWELDSGHNKYLGRDDKKSGYRGRVYRRKINESDFEYAYAYAGTTALDLGGDWKSNLDQHLGKNSDQYATAMAISSEVSAEFDSSELTFVGHSLGGGLAKVSSATTGRSAVTFNSAYVNIQTIKSHLDKGGMIYDSKITSYYTQNDILNFYYGQNHFGSNTNNIMIKTPKVKVSKWNLPHINLLIRIKSHMMGTVFENI